MDDAEPDIVTLLRVTARAAPPSNAVTRLNDDARDMLVAAADEIELLREKVLFAEQWATGLPRFVNDPAHRALIDEIMAFTKELKG